MLLEGKEYEDLRRAVAFLENPSFISRITDYVGRPVEKFIDYLPAPLSGKIQETVKDALDKLLIFSAGTMDVGFKGAASTAAHKVATGVSGAIGGVFGIPALAVELPISTAIILRSIADIARSEGEDIQTLPARMACLEVFAIGGRSSFDDAAETGYFAVRAALAKAVSDAAKHIAEKGLAGKSAPAIARLVSLLASRFGAVVSEKAAAQAIPLIGALGGATINLLFMDHFQDVARGHFIIRRLERRYGKEAVYEEYEKIRSHKGAL
ncbi:MAG: EcsC family protein [Desulfobacterales bacterium]